MLFDRLLMEPLLLLSSVMVKTRLLIQLGGFDEELKTAEDTHLFLRIARNRSIVGGPGCTGA